MPDPIHHPHYTNDDIVNVETHHEETDVDVRALLWFTVVFVVFAVVMHFGLLLLFKFFVQLERGDTNARLTSIARSPEAGVPGTPRLQPFPTKDGEGVVPPNRNTPVTDLDDMRAHEDGVLNNYGWVDQGHGIVHIPIEEAKRLALQSNAFPVNGGGATPDGLGNSAAAPAGTSGASQTGVAPPATGATTTGATTTAATTTAVTPATAAATGTQQ
jgi:hypothetical protein